MGRQFEGGICQLATRIPRGLHRQVRLAALDDEVTLQAWIADALVAYLAGRGRKPVATVDEDAPKTRVGPPPRRAAASA